MRRFIAVFSLCIFIFFHFLSFQPVSAVSSVDYGEMLNIYLGAAETALAASQGVTIDWSNVDLPAGSDTWTDQQKAQYIVQYVGNLKNAGLKFWYDFLFGEEQNPSFDVISAETAAIGLSSTNNINTQDIKSQLDNILATHSQDHVFQRYSDKIIALWNEYNTNYINDYIDQMNPVSDLPVPSPDDNYLSTLNVINGIDTSTRYSFFFANYPASGQEGFNTGNQWNATSLFYPYTQYSWYFETSINASGNNTPNGFPAPIQNINIVSNNGTYSFTSTIVVQQAFTQSVSNSNQKGILFGYPGTARSGKVGYQWVYNTDSLTIQASGSLSDCLNVLQQRVRNVNIYVDGNLWALANNNITSGLTFNVPDAVIDSGVDDGKIVAHPIYYPDAMNTDKAIDIDLDKVVDAIASRIAVGDTDITFDDLVDAGAAVKLDGTTLTDADTIVKDVSVPIARAKVDTIDGVIPTIDVVPPLPPLPPINPGDYSGEGFSGMSVLARIINTTVQSLPTPVILTFFGVVFGAVILGIIKILHH